MVDEKRRFFRINENIGLSYERLDQGDSGKSGRAVADLEVLIGSQTNRIDQLLADVSAESPKVAALVQALNQKLDLVLRQLLEAQVIADALRPARQVNISACGLGLWSDHEAAPGSHWRLVLELPQDDKKIQCKGILIACDKSESRFYWRFDFYGMSRSNQELLIQHIVQRQAAQLKHLRSV